MEDFMIEQDNSCETINEETLLELSQLREIVEEQRRVMSTLTNVYSERTMKGLDIALKVKTIDDFKQDHGCSDEQACKAFNISRMTLFRYRKEIVNYSESDLSLITDSKRTKALQQEDFQQNTILRYLTPNSDEYLKYYPSVLYVVYFFHNSSDDLLYVGRTNNFCIRWKDHCNSDKPMHEVSYVNVHIFDTKQEMYFYETQKIAELNPLWNKSILSDTISVYNMSPKEVHRFVCKIPEK